MKKRTVLSFIAVIGILLFTACSSDDDNSNVSVRQIALSSTSLTLKPGNTEQLTVEFFPSNATNRQLRWSSTDESVVTVSDEGLVTAIKPGSSTIKAVSADNGEESSCSVVVSESDPVTVSGDVSGVWEKYSIVYVEGHINIPEGKTLTIEEGVEVIISSAGQDANATKIEWIVRGNLYSLGTEDAPVLITVPASERTTANTFARLWGGIIGSETCNEILLDYTIVEYAGAVTTISSPSVTGGLFKVGGGEGMVAFNTNNPSGKYVITNSVFRNCGEDAIYVQGGNCIFTYNLFYAIGESGAEAINVKAGCKVDAAYNLIYSANTNALKLSNNGADGGERFQAQINGYNNTIVNTGWRRDPSKPKGGSIWAEAGCLVNVYNNLIVNSMFGVKAPGFGEDATEGPDLNSKIDYNFYASGPQQSSVPQHIENGTVTAYDGFKPGVQDVVYGINDVAGTSAGTNDPLFENFPFSTNPLLSFSFDESWDFHLQAGSPALSGAKVDFIPYFSTNGISINGRTYTSPLPSSYFGAFGQK